MKKVLSIPLSLAPTVRGLLLGWLVAQAITCPRAWGSQSVTLGWNLSTDSAAVGSAIYYGTSSGAYSARVDAGTNATLTISGLTEGVTYYFVATAYDADGVESIFSNETSYQVPVSLSGTVAYNPMTYPASGLSATRVANVTMAIAGATNATAASSSDGCYALSDPAYGGTVSLTPSKSDDTPVANGVDILDLVLMRAQILAVRPLASPYSLLAADVNGDGSVDIVDLVLLRALILAQTNRFPAGLWRFVPADYVFPNPQKPWGAPACRWSTNLVADALNQDFVAIKLGDVDGSWTPPITGSSQGAKKSMLDAQPTVTFTISHEEGAPGQTVTASVSVSGCSQVNGAQCTIAWDPTVLQYVSTGGYALRGLSAGNFGTGSATNGKLTLAWDDPEATGVSLPDGSVIFTLSFTVVGAPGSGSALTFSDTPTASGVAVNLGAGLLLGQAGAVNVTAPAGPAVSDAGRADGSFHLTVPTEQGRRYVLEFSDRLPATNWVALPSVVGDGTPLVLTDPSATNAQRFYRVRAE